MKALIRNEGETVTEDMNILGIDWDTGAPLTNPYWAGGPYTLVENYIPPVEDIVSESEVTDDDIDQAKAVLIAELKKLLAEREK